MSACTTGRPQGLSKVTNPSFQALRRFRPRRSCFWHRRRSWKADTDSTGDPIAMVSESKYTHALTLGIHRQPPAAVCHVFSMNSWRLSFVSATSADELTTTSCGRSTWCRATGGRHKLHAAQSGTLGFSEKINAD